ncbi:hypothetical protein QVD17_04389 [Tagetes erecta]|uniref:Methyltransferase n=1 Tax=Tagetes erecta TaxID=13708 RepID=A0AAD8LJG5_TARER|nr:hypothetical protein QVD17_04389 [Tagetes erecta]
MPSILLLVVLGICIGVLWEMSQLGVMAKELVGSRKKQATRILAVSGLCILFYVLGAWQSSITPTIQTEFTNNVESEKTSNEVTNSSSSSSSSPPSLDYEDSHEFPPCNMSYSEYTPCQDTNRGNKFDREMYKYRERHCPTKEEQLYCLIPAPPNYKPPFKWPKSRDYAWFNNIPHKELSIEKARQNWIKVEGDRFRFPGGGTMFRYGADSYIDDITKLIPLSNGTIRTAIDTGCGVASWGAYLLKRDIITMSFAPRDTHEAQVWFALERGVPAMIGIMASQRLPYPARSFDIAHCARCLIPWNQYDGLYLAEVDRVLRPGGYWILSGPPINWKRLWRGWDRKREDLKHEQEDIEDVARRLCWKKVIEKDALAVWQKPINHIDCIKTKNKNHIKPPICNRSNADEAWYKDMENCITPLPEVSKPDEVSGGALEKWPDRAMVVPPRIRNNWVAGITEKNFQKDNEMWKERVSHYTHIVASLTQGRCRNILDMNAYIGGFSAALVKYPVWVMNVVPVGFKPDTLGVIYERGFIGVYHDWCEAFSTYPRTYDFIHASGVLSMYQDRCDITNILLEMDRILRPEGSVVFRDEEDVIKKIKSIVKRMRWNIKTIDQESGSLNGERVLVAVKSYWTG